jgi:hypothetical protein
MAHGGGKGAARGSGFGFGHASLGNPALSSHSRSTSHRGETHDARIFFNQAQDHTDYSKKADQVAQIDDRGPGKERGFVDSLVPGHEQQADPGEALNASTIHSDPGNVETLGFPLSQEQQADPGMPLTSEPSHSDPGDIATRRLPPERIRELEADKQQLSQEIKLLKEKIDLLIRRRLEMNLPSGESLSTNWQANVGPGAIVSETDDTSVAASLRRWVFSNGRTKRLASTNPAPGGDDEGSLWWKLVPYFGAALFILSWIVQSGLAARKRKSAWLRIWFAAP